MEENLKRDLIGVVVSDKADKTITVKVPSGVDIKIVK